MSKPFAWSFSALDSFETCPWRHYMTRISKQVVEPQTQQLALGNEQHRAIDLALKGRAALPPSLRRVVPIVDALRRASGTLQSERKFALTPDYRETTYFAKDVWLRGVYDVALINGNKLTAIDWKTGKRKLTDQNKLMAACGFMLYPHVERVETAFAWIAQPGQPLDRESYTRADVPDLWRDFNIRVSRMQRAVETNEFPKRPSGLCRKHCPVGRSQCEHSGG